MKKKTQIIPAKLPTPQEVQDFDITALIGRDDQNQVEWPMYTYERPAYTLWNAVAKELFRRGWTLDEIRVLLQSKRPRWAMDGDLGEAIERAGTTWATGMANEAIHKEVKAWVREGA